MLGLSEPLFGSPSDPEIKHMTLQGDHNPSDDSKTQTVQLHQFRTDKSNGRAPLRVTCAHDYTQRHISLRLTPEDSFQLERDEADYQWNHIAELLCWASGVFLDLLKPRDLGCFSYTNLSGKPVYVDADGSMPFQSFQRGLVMFLAVLSDKDVLYPRELLQALLCVCLHTQNGMIDALEDDSLVTGVWSDYVMLTDKAYTVGELATIQRFVLQRFDWNVYLIDHPTDLLMNLAEAEHASKHLFAANELDWNWFSRYILYPALLLPREFNENVVLCQLHKITIFFANDVTFTNYGRHQLRQQWNKVMIQLSTRYDVAYTLPEEEKLVDPSMPRTPPGPKPMSPLRLRFRVLFNLYHEPPQTLCIA